MRFEGTLTKWNDDRGFGFITPIPAGQEIFVHVSAFAHDGRRPQLNEALSFEITLNKDGKSRQWGFAATDKRLFLHLRRFRTHGTGAKTRAQRLRGCRPVLWCWSSPVLCWLRPTGTTTDATSAPRPCRQKLRRS